MSRFSSSFRSVVTVFGFAAVTAAAGLAVAWPHTTYADGEQPVAQYTAEGTKFGDVVVKSDLVRDSKSKTGWVVVIVASNKSNSVASVSLEADLTQMVANPMGRVAPMAQTVWNTNESLTLAANQTVVKRFDVPAAIATRITTARAADAAAQAQAKQNNQMRPRTVFAVAIKSPTPAAAPQQPARPMPAAVTPAMQANQAAQAAQPMQTMQNAPSAPIFIQTL
jgi:hypothetical protein